MSMIGYVRICLFSFLVAGLPGALFAQSINDLEKLIDEAVASANATGAGITIAERERDGDGSLTLKDILIQPESEDFEAFTEFVKITPLPSAPGDVLITMADQMYFGTQERVEKLTLSLTTSGFELVTNWVDVMAGMPKLAVAADALRLKGPVGGASHSLVEGLDLQVEDMAIRFDYGFEEGDLDAAFSAGSFLLDYSLKDFGQGAQSGGYRYSQYQISIAAENLPQGSADLAQFVDQDGSVRIAGSTGPSSFSIATNLDELPTKVSGQGQDGAFELSFLEGVLLYSAESDGFNYEFSMDPERFPLPPLSVSLETLSSVIQLPLRPSETAQVIKMNLGLRGLQASDALWGVADPEGTIPRVPSDLVIDLDGEVELKAPVFETLAQNGGGDVSSAIAMGQINSLEVREVLLSFGGAEISGNGSLNVDNSGPFPLPTGGIDLSIKGVQALASSVGNLGIVEPEIVGAAMGGLLMIAKPTDRADEFTSRIEFDEDGLSANGVPLQ